MPSKSFAAPPTTKSVRVVEALLEICHRLFFLGVSLSKSTALLRSNALVQCKEGQVYVARPVTLVRDGFSTNFSTFLLKSFDLGGYRLPTAPE